MNRNESIEDFNNNIAKDLIEQCKNTFNEKLKDNVLELKKVLRDGIKSVVSEIEEVQKVNPEYRVYLLQFEFLRSNVLNDSYKVYISGYNESVYLDGQSISKEVDLKFLFKPLINLKEELLESVRKYLGKINKYDIESIILDAASKCYLNMVYSARECMLDIDEEEYLTEDVMGKYYFIQWAEYHTKGEIIFAMDNRKKEKEEFLELKKYPKEKMLYVYTVWKNVYFEDCDVSNQKMLFINFKESKLTKIDFSNNYLLKSQFEQTNIKKCKFINCKSMGSSFKISDIRETSFENADFRNVNFENSNLVDVDFKNTDLSNAVFIGCKFENVTFENSILENAIFSEDDIPYIHLSPQQLQKIYIWRQ